MSHSKPIKARVLGNDIFNSDVSQAAKPNTRQNNTFKSSILACQGYPDGQRKVGRDTYNPSRVLVSSVARTSFQDSNIFNYKDASNLTV